MAELSVASWITKEAVRTLVDVAIVGMTPDRADEAAAMNTGIQSLLLKLVGDTQTSVIVADAQREFKKAQENTRREELRKELIDAIGIAEHCTDEEARQTLDNLMETRGTMAAARNEIGTDSLSIRRFEAARGAVLAFDDVASRTYGLAYTKYVEGR